MTVFETVAAPQEGPPLHFHQLQDEWLYVLEGEMRFRLGDDVMPAPAGSFAFIPRGVRTRGRTQAGSRPSSSR
jgi:quercetin dioxygenase-like cupin family protein